MYMYIWVQIRAGLPSLLGEMCCFSADNLGVVSGDSWAERKCSMAFTTSPLQPCNTSSSTGLEQN